MLLLLNILAKVDWIKVHGAEQKLPGVSLSPQQLFWASFARIQCSKYSDYALRIKYDRSKGSDMTWDKHSPGEFRMLGVVQNSNEFSRDFNCSSNSTMNRKPKCKIW